MSTFHTVPEVAKIFQVCEQTVLNRVKAGKWPAWRDGRQIRFSPEDIEEIKSQGRQTVQKPDSAQRRARNNQIRATSSFSQ